MVMGQVGKIDAATFAGFVTRLKPIAVGSGAFGDVSVQDGMLCCAAAASAEPATYRVLLDDGALYVALVMENRWQSESIESDLMNTGDPIEELIEEELVDQGYDGGRLPVEHYRSDDMLFTFRSKLPLSKDDLASDAGVKTAAQCLLAYEACFAQLGDMTDDGDED
jgi:hypothetical protein